MNLCLCPPLRLYFHDGNGHPLAGGTVSTFYTDSTIPVQTYYDGNGTVKNPTTITLDDRGEATVFLDPSVSYRFVVRDRNGAVITEQDGVRTAGTGGGTVDLKSLVLRHYPDGSEEPTDIEYDPRVGKTITVSNLKILSGKEVIATYDPLNGITEVDVGNDAESKWATVKATEASESLGKGNTSTKFPIQRESGNIDPAELENGIYFVSGTVRMVPGESSGVELAGKIQASIGGMPTQNVPFRLQDTRETVFAFSGLVPESSGSLAVNLALDVSGDVPGTYTFRLETLSVFKVTGISSGSGGTSNIRVLQYGETVSDFDTLSSYDLVLCTMNSKIFVMTELTGTAGTFVSDYMVGGSLRTNYTKLEGSDGKTAEWSAIISTNADIDATTLDGLILTEAPIQKKLDSDSSHLVIYQDPVEASPLSRISTPSIDVIADSSSAAQGSGHGNGWTSVDMHVFSVQNYFVPKAGTDSFIYIVTQAQVGSVYNHQLGIYELDQENRKLHLVCLSGSCVSLDTTTGVKTVPVEYVSTEYQMIKPSRLYYAASFCDQPAVLVAGLKTNTFNLNPSSTDTPIGIWKSAVAYGSDSSEYTVDPSAVAEFDLFGFGMTAEHHFLELRHP